MTSATVPASILIIGSGVFGLSTAFALAKRPAYSRSTITLLDRSPFPSPDGSSIDTSRIVRADYSNPSYAKLAAASQDLWRSTPGLKESYSESGLVLVADTDTQGEDYVRKSFANVQALIATGGDTTSVTELPSRAAIDAEVAIGGGAGDWGYINRRSGWADAERAMRWLRDQVSATGRVRFVHGLTTSLLHSGSTIRGAALSDGTHLTAELVVLATGAWTGGLVDLRGRATATGQCLAYVDLTDAEQESLHRMPVLLNMSTGFFIIPPARNVLKIARHAYGYSNPLSISHPSYPDQQITVSLPKTHLDDPTQSIPPEGLAACRKALAEMIPSLATRPFAKTRICWYTDTPDGDFLISYHPELKGLFLATGGSGHGFKFLPVIGEAVVDCMEGRCPEGFENLWRWREEKVDVVVTEDGSRGGRPGMVLENEIGKGPKP